VERLARLAVRRFGQIDVWVEAVAVGVVGPLGSESVDELRRLVDTNVFGTALCARAALATFQAQGEGTLVLVGSLLSLFPNPLVPFYSMSKFGCGKQPDTHRDPRRPLFLTGCRQAVRVVRRAAHPRHVGDRGRRCVSPDAIGAYPAHV
jgi:NADP-dependent 3-hydroxy acid dehydrogenase YdfG